MRVRYLGPARRFRESSNQPWIRRGAVVELSEAAISRLRADRHMFEPENPAVRLPPSEQQPEPEQPQVRQQPSPLVIAKR